MSHILTNWGLRLPRPFQAKSPKPKEESSLLGRYYSNVTKRFEQFAGVTNTIDGTQNCVDFALGAFTAFHAPEIFDRMGTSLTRVTNWCDSIRVIKTMGYWVKGEFTEDVHHQNVSAIVSNSCFLAADVAGLLSFGQWLGVLSLAPIAAGLGMGGTLLAVEELVETAVLGLNTGGYLTGAIDGGLKIQAGDWSNERVWGTASSVAECVARFFLIAWKNSLFIMAVIANPVGQTTYGVLLMVAAGVGFVATFHSIEADRVVKLDRQNPKQKGWAVW